MAEESRPEKAVDEDAKKIIEEVEEKVKNVDEARKRLGELVSKIGSEDPSRFEEATDDVMYVSRAFDLLTDYVDELEDRNRYLFDTKEALRQANTKMVMERDTSVDLMAEKKRIVQESEKETITDILDEELGVYRG